MVSVRQLSRALLFVLPEELLYFDQVVHSRLCLFQHRDYVLHVFGQRYGVALLDFEDLLVGVRLGLQFFELVLDFTMIV